MGRGALLFVLALIATGLNRPAAAQDYAFLGMASFSTNDALYDGDDRWQTAGGNWSVMIGPRGLTELPSAPFELWELRLRSQVITPDEFETPAAWDRRAAGVLTATLGTYFQAGGLDLSAAAGVAATGPQTRLHELQNFVHSLTPANDPFVPAAVRRNQIPNAFYVTALGEAAYRVDLGDDLTLRPFVEVQSGVETFARAGFDVFAGAAFDKGVLARDGVTGFAYQTIKGVAPQGMTFTFGADVAKVTSSALLPEPAFALTEARVRARAGLHYQGKRASVFTGVSWLGPEFSAQPSGQFVSGVQLRWRF